MKAIAVTPGKAGTIHLEDVPKPSVDDIPEGRGVLVRVFRVGVDGTDKEINAAEYGASPVGDDFLIIGHENFGDFFAYRVPEPGEDAHSAHPRLRNDRPASGSSSALRARARPSGHASCSSGCWASATTSGCSRRKSTRTPAS